MNETFKSWMAVSPVASYLRTAFALAAVSALNFMLEHYMDWGLPLWAQFAVASAVPPVLRTLNDKDGIFGKGKNELEIDPSAEQDV